MQEVQTNVDRPPAPPPAQDGRENLIHDLMPAKDSLTKFRSDSSSSISGNAGSNSNSDASQSARDDRNRTLIADGSLTIPPLDYGSQSSKLAPPVDKELSAERSKSVRAAKDDPFQYNADKFLDIADSQLGKDLTVAPRGLGIGEIPKKYGCAAAMSNLSQKAGLFDRKEFSASVDGFESLLQRKGAEVVSASQLKKGDFVFGRGELDGSGGRHVGVVDTDSKGNLVVLNNHVGVLKSDTVQGRFLDRYKTVYGLRLPSS